MIPNRDEPGSSGRDDPSIDDKEIVPLKDLESGRSSGINVDSHDDSEDSSDVDDSIHLPDDGAGQGLLNGGTLRQSYREESSSRPRWCGDFLRGPQAPRRHRIRPFFENFQTAPLRLVNRLFPNLKARVIVIFLVLAIWSAMFLLILNQSIAGPDIPGYGKPNRLSCGTKLW